MSIHIFHWGRGLNLNIILEMEFEFTHNDIPIQHVSQNVTGDSAIYIYRIPITWKPLGRMIIFARNWQSLNTVDSVLKQSVLSLSHTHTHTHTHKYIYIYMYIYIYIYTYIYIYMCVCVCVCNEGKISADFQLKCSF